MVPLIWLVNQNDRNQRSTYFRFCPGRRPLSGFRDGGEKHQEERPRHSLSQSKVSTRMYVVKLYWVCNS